MKISLIYTINCVQRQSVIAFNILKYNNKMTAECNLGNILKLILAFIFPPLGVFLDRGCDLNLLINIILTLLGFIPGIIHAIYVIFFSA
ncbi:Proteolipid membrane potential modulator family-containing protein [Strongyloides ratti]|uniref:Proteolipid membrane potential modulator family-containing protein n=1 Tax=Strongyloides ratti TaxID=34506 RepID=A0A090MSJ7_STRRB|nr:Proteolipid membrane potential modulator family-containing protein [Strongyloides ratti]CEF61223.1 Proteolipid membrane potential modulator family-containing protein [Strongyloides ratti]